MPTIRRVGLSPPDPAFRLIVGTVPFPLPAGAEGRQPGTTAAGGKGQSPSVRRAHPDRVHGRTAGAAPPRDAVERPRPHDAVNRTSWP